MKKLMLLVTLSVLSFHSLFAWNQIPGGGLSVCSFAESSDGTRQIIGLQGGGYWLSNDSGHTWSPINNRVLPPNASTFYPDQIVEMEMLDAAGDTILTKYVCDRTLGWAYSITEDGGETWRILQPPADTFDAENNYASIDPLNHHRIDYAVDGKFFSSFDLGVTWTDSSEYLRMTDDISGFAYNSMDSERIYAYGTGSDADGINTSLFYSTNHGRTWIAPLLATAYFDMPGAIFQKLLVLSNGEIVAFSCSRYDAQLSQIENINTILRSTNTGMTWIAEEGVLPDNYIIEDAVEIPGFPGHILVIPRSTSQRYFSESKPWGIAQPFLSTDYGQTFSPVDSDILGIHTLFSSVSVNEFSNTVYLNSQSNGVYKSIDGGITWDHYQTLDPIGYEEPFRVTEDAILFTGQNYRIKTYNFDNEAWEEFEIDGFEVNSDTSVFHSIPVVDENGLTLVMSSYAALDDSTYSNRLLRRTTDSSPWEVLTVPFDQFIITKEGNNLSAYFGENSSRLVFFDFAGRRLRVHTSCDSASSWDSYEISRIRNFRNDILQREDEIFLLVERRDVFRSRDEGATWADLYIPNYSDAGSNELLMEDPFDGSIYTFYAGFLFRYDGSEWHIVDEGNGQNSYATIIPNQDGLPAFIRNYESRELFFSFDGGHNWERFDLDLPFRRQLAHLGQIEYDPWRNRVWINTSLGLMYANVEDFLSADDPGTAFVPMEVKPIYAYPNPFNASLNITYQVEQAGPVELKLYNISGREVASLVSQTRNRGSYDLSYDASSIASGTYFLKLKYGATIHTQKITLVK